MNERVAGHFVSRLGRQFEMICGLIAKGNTFKPLRILSLCPEGAGRFLVWDSVARSMQSFGRHGFAKCGCILFKSILDLVYFVVAFTGVSVYYTNLFAGVTLAVSIS